MQGAKCQEIMPLVKQKDQELKSPHGRDLPTRVGRNKLSHSENNGSMTSDMHTVQNSFSAMTWHEV